MQLNLFYLCDATRDEAIENVVTKTVRGCNHQSFASVTMFMFGWSDTQIYDSEVRDEGSAGHVRYSILEYFHISYRVKLFYASMSFIRRVPLLIFSGILIGYIILLPPEVLIL